MVTAIADAKAAATERGSPPGTKPAPPCRMGAWNSAFEKGEANCRSWRRSTASHTLTSKNLSAGPELSGVPARARKVERVLSCLVSSRAICALRAEVLARRSGPSHDATLCTRQLSWIRLFQPPCPAVERSLLQGQGHVLQQRKTALGRRRWLAQAACTSHSVQSSHSDDRAQ